MTLSPPPPPFSRDVPDTSFTLPFRSSKPLLALPFPSSALCMAEYTHWRRAHTETCHQLFSNAQFLEPAGVSQATPLRKPTHLTQPRAYARSRVEDDRYYGRRARFPPLYLSRISARCNGNAECWAAVSPPPHHVIAGLRRTRPPDFAARRRIVSPVMPSDLAVAQCDSVNRLHRACGAGPPIMHMQRDP